MGRVLIAAALAGLWAAFAAAAAAQPIVSVKLKLPTVTPWTKITDKSTGEGHLREWVPQGETAGQTDWIISEERLDLGRDIPASRLIYLAQQGAKDVCTDVLYGNLHKIMASGHATYSGGFMCAREKGRNYGTFTMQRVAVQGELAYVITSELRVPPSRKAGQFESGSGQLAQIKALMDLQALSVRFVNDSVTFCVAGQSAC